MALPEMAKETVAASGAGVPGHLRDGAEVSAHHVAAQGDLEVAEDAKSAHAKDDVDDPRPARLEVGRSHRHDIEQDEAAEKTELRGHEEPEVGVSGRPRDGPPPRQRPHPRRLDFAKLRIGVVVQIEADHREDPNDNKRKLPLLEMTVYAVAESYTVI